VPVGAAETVTGPPLPPWLRRPPPDQHGLAIPDGPAAAGTIIGELGRLDLLHEWEPLIGWQAGDVSWIHAAKAPVRTVLGGYALTDHIDAGRVHYLPVRLSRLPKLLSDRFRPAVTVVRGRPSRGGFAFGSSVGWGPAAARNAGRVVVEVDETGPAIATPLIPGRIDLVVESQRPHHVPAPRAPSDADRTIGHLVAGLLPEDATIQTGPGVIGDAVIDAIDVAVQVWSGQVSDALVGLERRGLLRGRATAAYLYGGEGLHDLAADGRVRLVGVDESHDPARLSGLERFVAVNTALEVGLDGTVNIQQVGGRVVAGVGGHADFCAGAASSAGGLSVIALRASRAGRSSIVRHPEKASTPAIDIDVVVTEYGVADLRRLDDRGRALALMRIADPAYRNDLSKGVKSL
jgi:acyl-CoA hydrolase